MLLATFFYTGYLPLVPGTFGSIAGLALFYASGHDPIKLFLLTAIVTASGFIVSGRAEEQIGKKDPSCIVIDEVSGMLISLIFLPQHHYGFIVVLMGFLIFRLLDTVKPYPAGALQRLRGGSGIMADDIVAGIYTNILLQAVLRFASVSAS